MNLKTIGLIVEHRGCTLNLYPQESGRWSAYATTDSQMGEGTSARAAMDACVGAIKADAAPLRPEDVEWVVNHLGELGVKIGNQFFWLYKGESLVYHSPPDLDEPKPMWRAVEKREFGETVHPQSFVIGGQRVPSNFTERSDGWQPMPLPPVEGT